MRKPHMVTPQNYRNLVTTSQQCTMRLARDLAVDLKGCGLEDTTWFSTMYTGSSCCFGACMCVSTNAGHQLGACKIARESVSNASYSGPKSCQSHAKPARVGHRVATRPPSAGVFLHNHCRPLQHQLAAIRLTPCYPSHNPPGGSHQLH